jgi:glyoxylase-like metal-dependent hydrolase (beta-lactamase superfamily II)
MRIRFLGTRGEIEHRTRMHGRHSALLIVYRGREVMVDCGVDWLAKLEQLSPRTIVLTHAHPDHAGGLARGSPGTVHATAETWAAIHRYPIRARELVRPREPFTVSGIRFEAFPLEHSLRAPAVGYRVSAGRARLFYAPDVVAVHDRRGALAGVDLYVGDGANVTRRIVRRREDALIGHASIREQLQWCAAEGVRHAIFTHCGSQIVRATGREAERKVEALGREHGIDAAIAYDGLEIGL